MPLSPVLHDFALGNRGAHSYFGNIDLKSKKSNKYPCLECGSDVSHRSKAISCDVCEAWIHVKCTNDISTDRYNSLATTGENFAFTCKKCTLTDLPYADSAINTPSEPKNIRVHDIDLSCFKAKGLHFIGLNIRSLLPKLSELKLLTANISPATICLSETWLDDSVTDNEIALPNYSIVRKDRNRHGGGVCLYIRSDLSFNVRSDLHTSTLEAVWIDLLLPKTKPILVSSIYRPPDQHTFLDDFSVVLKQIGIDQESYILGDFNICTKNKDSPLYKTYSSHTSTSGYTQIITSLPGSRKILQ